LSPGSTNHKPRDAEKTYLIPLFYQMLEFFLNKKWCLSKEPVKTLMFAISLDLYLRYPERIDLDVRRYK